MFRNSTFDFLAFGLVSFAQVRPVMQGSRASLLKAAAAAAVVFCVQLFKDTSETLPFAKLLDSESVVWSDTSYDAGDNLVDETFTIRSGVARLGLDNGVVVTLEGPAEIEFNSCRMSRWVLLTPLPTRFLAE